VNLFQFFDEMVRAARERNRILAELEVEVGLLRSGLGTVRYELATIAEALERIADAFVPKDGGVSGGLSLGPEIDDPADHGGTPMLQIVSVIRDSKMKLLKLTLPLTSEGGNPITGSEGEPWPATGWTVTSDDPEILGVTANDGTEPGFPTDPAELGGFFLRGRKTGQCTGKATLPMPDGSTFEVPILHTTTLGGVGAAAFVLGDEQDDPNPTA
jgi:hypothetical protein